MKSRQNSFYFNGHTIPESEQSMSLYEGIETAIAFKDGIHSFSSTDKFDAWITQSPLLKHYQEANRRLERALEMIEKAGGEEIHSLLHSINSKLKTVNSDLTSLIQLLDRDINTRELRDFTKIALSPKMGTVRFFKEPDFRNSFDDWNGHFHISNNYVGDDDNDTLTSIKVAGAGITLFEHSRWRGRKFYIAGAWESRNLGWFDNIMSSYFFWA